MTSVKWRPFFLGLSVLRRQVGITCWSNNMVAFSALFCKGKQSTGNLRFPLPRAFNYDLWYFLCFRWNKLLIKQLSSTVGDINCYLRNKAWRSTFVGPLLFSTGPVSPIWKCSLTNQTLMAIQPCNALLNISFQFSPHDGRNKCYGCANGICHTH